MDPLKALDELDQILGTMPMDRNGHTAVMGRVLVIRAALNQPASSPQADGSSE